MPMKTMLLGHSARILSLFLALVMLLGPAAPVRLFAEGEFTATVTGGALRLRQKPDDHSRVLGRYKSGTEVVLLADGERYCRVRTPDRKEGYMMKSFLDIKNGLPPMEEAGGAPEPAGLAAALAQVQKDALARGIDPARPMLALTFDDGPSPVTPEILDALKANGARATFFILGRNIAGHEATLRRTAEEGHELANHSWSHPHLTDISDSAVRGQMTRTSDKIEEITGKRPIMMRPPFGSTNRLSRRVLVELDLPVILWAIDTLDWKTKSASKTASAILKGAGNGAIILCHDTWPSTARALETALPQLIAKGYQLVTVSEMMSFREEPIKAGWEYSHLDPKKIVSVTPYGQEAAAP